MEIKEKIFIEKYLNQQKNGKKNLNVKFTGIIEVSRH